MLWLVTLRAADGHSEDVVGIVRDRLLPLLSAAPGCSDALLATCVHCSGEFTYLAQWSDRAAVERFECDHRYVSLASEIALLLRVPPKRELWEVISGP